MAIIKCPECNASVSDRAPVCPTCGAEIRGKVTICPTCDTAYFTEKGECPKCALEKNTAAVAPVKETTPIKYLLHHKIRNLKKLLFCLHLSLH